MQHAQKYAPNWVPKQLGSRCMRTAGSGPSRGSASDREATDLMRPLEGISANRLYEQ